MNASTIKNTTDTGRTLNTMTVLNNFPVKLLLFVFCGSFFHYHVLSPSFVEGQAENPMKRSIFAVPTFSGASCAGSVEIETTSGDKVIIIDNETSTSIPVKSVKVRGCGCYSIHSRKYGRGSRQVMFPLLTLDRSGIGFSRIRSIYRINCPTY